MAVFRSPAKQAASVMRELQGTILKSVRTVENYERGLTRVTEWTQREKLSDGLRGLTRDGQVCDLARLRMQTELAGACFSPDGRVLFVNLFSPGQTVAITGPWAHLAG